MSAWLTHQPVRGSVVLLCIPFAGGGASSFAGWRRRGVGGAEVCSVQLPGRESRSAEQRFTDYDQLLGVMRREVLPYLVGRRVVFYGHSLGATIAWDLALLLVAQGTRPLGLISGAQRAPSCPYPFRPHVTMNDHELLVHLREHDLLREGTLDDELLLRWTLPLIRDDLSLCETQRRSNDRASFPILSIGGRRDLLVTEPEIMAWGSHGEAGLDVEMLEAGHMFLRTHPEHLHRSVERAITRWS